MLKIANKTFNRFLCISLLFIQNNDFVFWFKIFMNSCYSLFKGAYLRLNLSYHVMVNRSCSSCQDLFFWYPSKDLTKLHVLTNLNVYLAKVPCHDRGKIYHVLVCSSPRCIKFRFTTQFPSLRNNGWLWSWKFNSRHNDKKLRPQKLLPSIQNHLITSTAHDAISLL